ncbi:MAG: hypothetical protein HOW73_27030 [Polyangiaceae bacterium]|nr:hypothetical protein [Polyangiaceae bacterium]
MKATSILIVGLFLFGCGDDSNDDGAAGGSGGGGAADTGAFEGPSIYCVV